jgi:hypothetical protein
MICCANPKFKLVAELGHAEAVDWGLGRCLSCGAHLLSQWSEYAADKVFYDKLSDDDANVFLQADDKQRKSLLNRWHPDN